jgi:predicted glycoside hydrolase/deacetylase ChbG (UPF0249 family)
LSVGLHLDLGEWAFQRGEWRPMYSVVEDGDDLGADEELSRQLGSFLRMVGRPPTHLDSHQNVHLREPLRSRVAAIGERLDIPIRGLTADVRYCGGFYGQWSTGEPLLDGITFEGLLKLLGTVLPGATELSCHPGTSALVIDSMYVRERALELSTLCDPRLPEALARLDVALGSFHDLRRA